MTKLQAIAELVQHDHGFLTPKGVEKIVKPFGLDPKQFIYKAQDTRSQFKGLYCPDVKEGNWVEGADSSSLAEGLCRVFKVKYWPMHGRGSALRECCRALKEHFSR